MATLVRVIFDQPQTGRLMLCLERKATVVEAAGRRQVDVRAQPFGGAVRLRRLAPLRRLIGDFLFDSERSRAEQDFRILIRPAAWEAVRKFCWQSLTDVHDVVLESDPGRELAEEFADALAISLKPSQYRQQPAGVIVADRPVPTRNARAPGLGTARIYRIFEARLLDAALAQAMLANSERLADQDLHERALTSARRGGASRANAVLAVPLAQLTQAYLALSPEARGAPVVFEDHRLDENVPAILEGVAVPDYSYVTAA